MLLHVSLCTEAASTLGTLEGSLFGMTSIVDLKGYKRNWSVNGKQIKYAKRPFQTFFLPLPELHAKVLRQMWHVVFPRACCAAAVQRKDSLSDTIEKQS